jgi:tRNA (cmo5U34)-methyltransferase
MVKSSKPILAFTGRWASDYDARMPVVLPGYNLMHEIVATYLRVILPQTSNILVIGAGTGIDMLTLIDHGPRWQITGLEPSREMFQIACEKIESIQLPQRLRLECCKVEDFIDATVYDVAVVSLVLQLYPDDGAKRDLLQTVARHVKPKGCIVVIDSFGDCESPHFDQTVNALKVLTTRMGFTEDEANKDIESVKQRFYLVPEERIRSVLTEAGIVCVEQIFRAFITGVWIGQLAD